MPLLLRAAARRARQARRSCSCRRHSTTGEQLLPVPDVLPSFPAVRWAAAYGSAALRQAGYKKKNDSMIDYLFAVDAPREWHAANMAANPQHYSFLRYLGAGAAARVQERWACGVYYNTLVDWGDTRIKYGVISTAQLTEDLRDWRHLYVAGRLHKPVATLRADEEIERAQQANLDHALDAARLMLPESFSERDLYRAAAGLSYLGDYRMQFGENPHKVRNIVDGNIDAFNTLYSGALARTGLVAGAAPEPEPEPGSRMFEQGVSSSERAAVLERLPPALLQRTLAIHGSGTELSELAGSPELAPALRQAVGEVVRTSARAQSLQALVTAGVVKCAVYLGQKLRRTQPARGAVTAS